MTIPTDNPAAMHFGRPSKALAQLWQLLADAGPAGALMSMLCAQLGITRATCKQCIYRLRAERGFLIGCVRHGHDALYVLDISKPPKPPRERGEPTRAMQRLIGLLQTAGPAGVDYAATTAAGITHSTATYAMQLLSKRGHCFGARLPAPGCAQWTYWSTAEQRDAAVAQATAASLNRRRAQARERDAKRRATGEWNAARELKKLSDPKPRKARTAKVAPVSVVILRKGRKAAPVQPSEPVVIDYSRAKLTVCPAGADQRFTFTPPPGWRGEFGREWDARRGVA